MKHYVCFLTMLASLFLISCEKETPLSKTYYGPQVHMGDGKVRSWIRISRDGAPEEIGLEITPEALQNLPQAPPEATGEHPFDFVVPLHQKAKDVTPYNHIEVDWQPIGHAPAGIFSIPHFDIHFYMLTEEEQMSVPTPTAANAALFDAPPAGYLPADYTFRGPAVAHMGRHWLDRTSTTLPTTLPASRTLFTHEMVYGTFNGKVVFLEPMITRDFLLTGTEVHQAFKQPTIFDPAGNWYPTMYNIFREKKTDHIYVSLSNFMLR